MLPRLKNVASGRLYRLREGEPNRCPNQMWPVYARGVVEHFADASPTRTCLAYFARQRCASLQRVDGRGGAG